MHPTNGKLRCLLICYLLITFSMLYALPSLAKNSDSYNYKHIGTKDDLPDMTVFQIAQDHHGFMWFGTRNGVAKYDGIKLISYQHTPNNPNSLSHNDSGGVLEDNDYNIWIRTWGGGLNRINPKTGLINVFKKIPGDKKSLSGNRVQLIYKDKRGFIWAGTFRAGLNRFEKTGNNFKRFTSDGKPGSIVANRIWSMAETKNENLWIGTDNGLHLYNRDDQTFKVYHYTGEYGEIPIKNQIRALFKKASGGLWVGTNQGLRFFNSETKTFFLPAYNGNLPLSVRSKEINCLYEDKTGKLWIGTHNGLVKFDPASGQTLVFRHDPFKKGTISHNDIRCITEDRSGVLWIGTRGGGVNRLSQIFSRFTIHKEYESSHGCNKGQTSIHAILKDFTGKMIIGTWYNGLTVIDKNGNCRQFTINNNFLNNDINSLLELSNNRILTGTWNKGLQFFNSTTESFFSWHDLPAAETTFSKCAITALAMDPQRNLWVGTRDKGLFRGEISTGKTKKIHTDNSPGMIKVLLPEKSGHLWIGTTNGLYVMNSSSSPVLPAKSAIPLREPLSNNVITALASGRNKSLWVGTYQGLNLINTETGKLKQYLQKDGLSGVQIKSIICDKKGSAWITTERGVSKVEPDINRILNFYTPVFFNEGASFISETGKLFFGGENGYISFTPETIKAPENKQDIVITGISVLDSELKQGQTLNNRVPMTSHASDTKKLVLKHNENYFSISFAMMDFNNPKSNSLQYMLEGYDKRWHSPPKNPVAKYSGVTPGNYRFVVRGASSIGIPGKNTACIDLTITAPIWRRWYVKTAAATLTVILIIMLIYIRFKRIRRMNQKLQYLVDIRTRELLEQKDKLEALSVTDPLTGALNRRGFSAHFKAEVTRNKRNKHPLTIVLTDIDDFKIVNDTYGHDCGDLVLQEVVSQLKGLAREQDILGRWGGEEFILLLPDTPVEGALIFSERLRTSIAEIKIPWNGEELKLSMTFGIAGCNNEEPMESIVSHADKALYTGKNRGKNCSVIYEKN